LTADLTMEVKYVISWKKNSLACGGRCCSVIYNGNQLIRQHQDIATMLKDN